VMLLSFGICRDHPLYRWGRRRSVRAEVRRHALMADVNGLKPGAPVRVGGVEVGRSRPFSWVDPRVMVDARHAPRAKVQDADHLRQPG